MADGRSSGSDAPQNAAAAAPIQRAPVIWLALSTWILAVSSVHVSVLLFGRDMLAIPFLQGDLVSVDGWSLVHVLFYYAVALSYPGKFWWMMALGVAWEFAEAAFAGHTEMGTVWAERGINSLWDIYFNGIGYRLGETYLQKLLTAAPTAARRSRLNAVSPYPIVVAFSAFCMGVGVWGLLQGKDPAALVTGSIGMAICWTGWAQERLANAKERDAEQKAQ